MAAVGKAALRDNALLFSSSSFIKLKEQQPAPPERNNPPVPYLFSSLCFYTVDISQVVLFSFPLPPNLFI